MPLHGQAFLTEEGGVLLSPTILCVGLPIVERVGGRYTTKLMLLHERQVNGRMRCPKQMLRELISGMVLGGCPYVRGSQSSSLRDSCHHPDHHRV